MSTSLPPAKAKYDELMDPWATTPAPPVHVARLSTLLKSLATAENAVEQSMKARRELVGCLEKLLQSNRTALAAEEADHSDLTERKQIIESKKRDVEDSIMRSLAAPESADQTSGGAYNNGNEIADDPYHSDDPERPRMEELTPPPIESITPIGSPSLHLNNTTGADIFPEQLVNHEERPLIDTPPLMPVGADLLSSLTTNTRSYSQSGIGGDEGREKRVRVDDGSQRINGDNFDLDLERNVDALIRSEGGGM